MIIVNGNASVDKILPDSGFNFGRGVFETIRVTSAPLFLSAHLARLNRGLHVLKLDLTLPEQYVSELVHRYQIKNCVLKIVATEKNIVLSTRPVTYTPEQYERGFKVKISSLRRNPYSRTAYIKSLNYTDNLLEKEQAAAEGYDEALFFNTDMALAEGTASNVFVVLDGKLHTPPLRCGILDGIVRAWVLDNFDVAESRITPDALSAASAVFLTNSVMGVMKVKSIGATVYEDGPICKTVRDKYDAFIRDC